MFDTIAIGISRISSSMCFSKTSKSIDRLLIHVTYFLILIRHKRRYIYICLQLPCFIWKPEQFEFQVYGSCVTQAYDRVCRKIYTNLIIFEPFRSQSIRKSAYVNSCLFSTSTDNQKAKVSSRCLHCIPVAILVYHGCTPTKRFHTGLCKYLGNIYDEYLKFGETHRPRT